jgi:hypothetical protein
LLIENDFLVGEVGGLLYTMVFVVVVLELVVVVAVLFEVVLEDMMIETKCSKCTS